MTRVAIVGGVRTPFVKAFGAFGKSTALDLSIHVVESLVSRLQLKPSEVQELVFSSVLLNSRTPNAAREIVLRSSLDKSIPAHFISNNCISGLVAVTFLADAIRSGRLYSGLAGGAESMSTPTLTAHPKAEEFFLSLASARSLGQKLSLLPKFPFSNLMPQAPSPKEPSTGLTMGQHCEITTKEFAIERRAQDELAFRSHQSAARAATNGYLSEEIAAFSGVTKDTIIRADTSLEKLAALKPVFDTSEKGTLTAGNSSPLTDGASVVCLMSEEYARSSGREILGFVEAVEYAAVSPQHGLLMAPGLALPRLLQRCNLTVADIDLFDVHEAFAAQVLANQKVWAEGWKHFPELQPIGVIPTEKINKNGGSISIGHPFAATGGRLILSALNELKRSGGKKAALSVCAAGAMGCAMLLSRE
jgi:acetyl-CoA acetyltransferase family protein